MERMSSVTQQQQHTAPKDTTKEAEKENAKLMRTVVSTRVAKKGKEKFVLGSLAPTLSMKDW